MEGSSPIRIELMEDIDHRRNPPFYTRSVKIDFPKFEGEDVLPWIYKSEQFFMYYQIPDPHRLEIASIHFDGTMVSDVGEEWHCEFLVSFGSSIAGYLWSFSVGQP